MTPDRSDAVPDEDPRELPAEEDDSTAAPLEAPAAAPEEPAPSEEPPAEPPASEAPAAPPEPPAPLESEDVLPTLPDEPPPPAEPPASEPPPPAEPPAHEPPPPEPSWHEKLDAKIAADERPTEAGATRRLLPVFGPDGEPIYLAVTPAEIEADPKLGRDRWHAQLRMIADFQAGRLDKVEVYLTKS